MAERPAFQDLQYAFAAHIRDPGRNPRPEGVEDRRMAIYRDLFFNNISQLLAGTFPVLRKILDDGHWDGLIREFLVRHRARTPLFLEVPREFLQFLEEEREDPADPPFLVELAHYEWVELALQVDEAEPDLSVVDREGDLMAGRPVISPLAWPLAYSFPVHRIAPDFQPGEPGESPTFLVVYRDLEDRVQFLEVNAATARMLELLSANAEEHGEAILRRIAAEMEHPDPGTVVRGGAEILEDLRKRSVILGTRVS